MTCSGIDIANPFSWIFFAGLAAGFGIAFLLPKPKTRWALSAVCFSLALMLGVLGLFMSGPERFLDIRLPIFFGGAAAFSFVGTLFKKSFGIPLVLFLSVVFLFLTLSVSPFLCFTDDLDLCSIRSLPAADDNFSVEISIADTIVTVPDVKGPVIFEIYLIRTDDPYFFFRKRNLIISFSISGQSAQKNLLLPLKGKTAETDDEVRFLSEILSRFVQNHGEKIPGVSYTEIRSVSFLPEPYKRYRVSVIDRKDTFLISLRQLFL